MKNFDSRTYSINDFLEWNVNNQLELNPKFQRRNVWSDRARSFLMDTIVRGKPIPKVFIRQKINATTKASIREVVDGQQRLRTILSYLNDGFMISKRHHSTYGGRYFSQLGDVDDQIQTNILNYEVSVDLLVNMPDEEVLDVFSRLNAYAVILNEQEKINASHFGPFKILADNLGHSYADFLVKNRVLNSQKILRMDEVNLSADLLIAMIEGIKSKKQIKHSYDDYEEKFEHDVDELERRFRATMAAIEAVFEESLPSSEFRRVHLFYTLFTSFFHARYGLNGFAEARPNVDQTDRIRHALNRVDELFAEKLAGVRLDARSEQFIDDSRRATTDAPVRARRTAFVVSLMNAA
jgi:hypothetical protein